MERNVDMTEISDGKDTHQMTLQNWGVVIAQDAVNVVTEWESQ